MAAKFVTLDEAAEMLGVSKERLGALREAGKIHGYRDGASWKFKEDEVERLRAQGLDDQDDPEDEISLDYESGALADLGEAPSDILVSERDSGEAPGATGSTVIGKSETLEGETLSGDADAGSQISLDISSAGDSSGDLLLAEDSDPSLASDVHVVAGASDILSREETGSGILSGDDGSSSKAFAGLEEVELGLDEESADVIDVDPSRTVSAEDSGLSLSAEDSAKAASASSLELDDDEGELLLGEGSGSDITLSSEDSGIRLIDPADSGLALDSEPLEMTGSMVGSLSLDDDEETFELESLSSPKIAGQPSAAENFELTPADDADESSSQVIALDSSEVEMSAGSAEDEEEAGVMLEEDFAEAAPAAAPAAATAVVTTGAAGVVVAEEPPYNVLNLMSLGLCLLLLSISGMMMLDIMRSMWSWNEPFAVNSSLIDGVLGMLGLS